MSEKPEADEEASGSPEREFWEGLARAFGGAILFSVPLLMTMEMWRLGLYMARLPLALLMVLMAVVLVVLAHYTGFKETTTLPDELADGGVAYGVGLVASAGVLWLLNLLHTDPLSSLVGKVALQAVPASFGAMLATSQFGGKPPSDRRHRREAGYGGTLFLMGVGAIFLAFNLAPTREVVLLAWRMTPWHGLGLALVSLLLMHAFVYAVNFHGGSRPPPEIAWYSLFLRYTVPGYAVALLVSAYVLWTFGRYAGSPLTGMAMQTVVLGFPAGIGAASARLIL